MAAFEWSKQKAAENYLTHGVSFEAATGIFADPFALEWLDDRFEHSEDRYSIVGFVQGRLLFVAYTIRGDVIRIISARGAEPNERRRYHEESR